MVLRAGKSVCLTGLPRIAGLLHVLRAERGPSPMLALAIVEVGDCAPIVIEAVGLQNSSCNVCRSNPSYVCQLHQSSSSLITRNVHAEQTINAVEKHAPLCRRWQR